MTLSLANWRERTAKLSRSVEVSVSRVLKASLPIDGAEVEAVYECIRGFEEVFAVAVRRAVFEGREEGSSLLVPEPEMKTQRGAEEEGDIDKDGDGSVESLVEVERYEVDDGFFLFLNILQG